MRPRNARRAGAVLVSAAALVVACIYLPKALSRFGEVATSNSRLSYADREIAGGNSVIVDQNAAYEARGLIPSADTFRVRVGPAMKDATPLTLTHAESWFRYFLMPRRPSPRARWIICYGCDTTELGPSYRTVWRGESGISIGRLG
jgi:hypothetical protein